MEPVDMKALVVELVDRLERDGAAGAFDVEEPTKLRELLSHEAHSRGINVRTGTITGDDHAVWVYIPK